MVGLGDRGVVEELAGLPEVDQVGETGEQAGEGGEDKGVQGGDRAELGGAAIGLGTGFGGEAGDCVGQG